MTDKITIERETLERAIEAFAMHANAYPHMLKGYMVDAADELRAALAQKAEPQSMQPLPNHDNHHNALKCPYCNPRRLKFADPEAAPPAPAAVPLTKEQRELFDLILHHYGPDKRLQPLRDLIVAAGDKT